MKRRRLGQHYLIDDGVVRAMVVLADISGSERVLEIGPGKGALSRELVGHGSSFEAFEVDRENYRIVREVLNGQNAKVILGDAFDRSSTFDVLVSSLPYSQSSRFVIWLSRAEYKRAVVLLQEDFVEKILAPPGSRNYRAISAIAQVSSQVEAISRVGREAFQPPPRVASMIVRFKPVLRLQRAETLNIQQLFSLRKRQVGTALSELGMSSRGTDFGKRRVFSLNPEEVHRLCMPENA